MYYIFYIVFSLSVTSIGAEITYECNVGVQCLALDRCTGLYRQWEEAESKDNVRHLIKMLFCGYTDASKKMPKVCCPADIYLSNKTDFTARVPKNPMPNPKVTNVVMHNSQPLSATASRKPNATCGVSNVDRIFGGQNTQIDEFPWMALLAYTNGSRTEYYCGGVLISSRYVLTAAHCVNATALKGWNLSQVRLGEWKLSENPDCTNSSETSDDRLCNNVTDVPVERAISHASFVPGDVNMHNDIALIRLSKDVEFTDFVTPICLPGADLLKNKFEGYDLFVAGWGKTEISSLSDVKLKVSVPVSNHTTCALKYSTQKRNITSTQLCAGGQDGKDSCKGDSGGSLMGQMGDKWTAIGIVSYGPTPCGTQGWPGIYTRVTSYMEWIKSNMQL